ncbi:MAG TPA: hypothetical protein VNL38_01290, partial [Candidatus Nitrosotenuis sp.]|nr:hypothetical protein [Candidatus Nitrosotenuis sp.]
MKSHKSLGDVDAGEVLRALADSREPMSLRELVRTLGVKNRDRAALKKLLTKLLWRREIEEVGSGRFRLPGRKGAPSNAPAKTAHKTSDAPAKRDANLLLGRMVAHRDGYGFVVPEEPVAAMDGDLFIPRDAMGDAMHGDRVAALITRRAPAGRWEGRVQKILRRAHPTVVGIFHFAGHRLEARERGNRVVPFDTRIQHDILIPPGEETPSPRGEKPVGANLQLRARSTQLQDLDGAEVNVELTKFPKGGL